MASLTPAYLPAGTVGVAAAAAVLANALDNLETCAQALGGMLVGIGGLYEALALAVALASCAFP